MFQKIINQFEDVNGKLGKLIETTEAKFNSMKVQNMEQTKKLEKEEMLLIFDLHEAEKKLESTIKALCGEKSLKEEKITSLLPFMDAMEKEKIMACQTTAIQFARKVKNNLKMNECLALAFLESDRIVMESIAHIATEEQLGNSLFMNEEF